MYLHTIVNINEIFYNDSNKNIEKDRLISTNPKDYLDKSNNRVKSMTKKGDMKWQQIKNQKETHV